LRYAAVLALLLAGGCSDDLSPPRIPCITPCGTPMVFFAPGSATLTDYSRNYLARLIQTSDEPCRLKTDPRLGLAIVVTGHADKSGPEDENRQLGLQRAKSVAAWLVELGVAREHVCTLSSGSERPIQPADGPERQNRRVDLSYVRMNDRPQGCM
jgi:outer membrane protein OmpA-like peptidoglycan-associated protein